MADEYILKHLQDVLDAINDLQSCFSDFPNRYDLFEKPSPLGAPEKRFLYNRCA